MCGLVGYVGDSDACEILMSGLRKLEYRGYDSAGLALSGNGTDELIVLKKAGKIDEGLGELLGDFQLNGINLGIGHTRWATHGEPNDSNAHPHTDCRDNVAVVHNGIIENHSELRSRLSDKGHEFTSETDTEVISHLIEYYLSEDMELLPAVINCCEHLRGAYAIAAIRSEGDSAAADEVVAVRKGSPLIVGIGEGENFLASDVPALLPYTRKIIILENEDIVRLTSDEIKVFRPDGKEIHREISEIPWDPQEAKRGGYPHFMLKEIEAQPGAWEAALSGRFSGSSNDIELEGVSLTAEELSDISHIYFVGCGTSYHAGMAAAPVWEKLLQVPTTAEIGSEFRYRAPLLDEDTLVVFISQSGETADTLASLELALENDCPTVCITNVVGSSMAREAGNVIYTQAGPEISVASTKTYTTQLLILNLLACYLSEKGFDSDGSSCGELLESMPYLAAKEESLLGDTDAIDEVAEYMADWEDAFFIGRGLDYASSLEGQLKLKEISYIHAEAYPAGELKHGTLALVEEGVPVVAVSTQPHLREKMASNVKQVRARGAWVAAVTDEPDGEIAENAQKVIAVPKTNPMLAPLFVGTALQVLAYRTAVLRNCPVDKPRNLAKSVTVE